MKPISVHVTEQDYQQFKSLAASAGRPVAELIREAMAMYLVESASGRSSIRELKPHDSGHLLADWTREELYDEMLEP